MAMIDDKADLGSHAAQTPDWLLEKIDRDDVLTKKQKLYFHHPATSPDTFPAPLDGLVDPPSPMAATASFIRFRDSTVLPMIAAKPANPNWPLFLRQVEIVLAWRETIAPEDRFWKPDP